MSDFASTVVALTTGLWWLWAFAATLAVAFVAGLALCAAAARPMPAPPANIDGGDWWERHVAEAVALSETPIRDAPAVDKLRAELNNEAAVVLWLSRESS